MLRKRVDQIQSLTVERQELQKAMAAADKERDDAETKHAEATAPVAARLDAIRGEMLAAEAAKRELFSTCNDADLLAEYEAASAKLTAAHKEASACLDAVSRARAHVRSEEAALERARRIVQGQDLVEEHQRLVKLTEREVVQREAELAKVEKRIAKLEREADGVRERMLVP
jgi:predicted  nucleic acid-binding Zn-ribbon protein